MTGAYKIMDLIDDLNNELIFSVLVEKKHTEKINSKEVPALINRLRYALQTIHGHDKPEQNVLTAPKARHFAA